MAVLLESIRFAPGELLRLLRWDGNARIPLALEAGGRITPEAGMGSRWHSHAELEFTVITRGAGLRYVGDHVQAFTDMDCVLVGSHLPHCWMEQGRTAGFACSSTCLPISCSTTSAGATRCGGCPSPPVTV